MKEVSLTNRTLYDVGYTRQRPKQIFLSFPISKSLLKKFDDAIAEERQLTKFVNITRSRILRTLVEKWIDCEVKA